MNDLKKELMALSKEQRKALLQQIKTEEKYRPAPEFDLAFTALVQRYNELDAEQKKTIYKRNKALLASIGLKAGTLNPRLDSSIKSAIDESGTDGLTEEQIKALPILATKKHPAIIATLNGARCYKSGKLSTEHWWKLSGKKYVKRPTKAKA